MPRQWLVFVILYVMGSTCFLSLPHVVFFHSKAEWIIPSVTGDIPPPMEDFSFTQISNHQAVLFGGHSPRDFSDTADLRLATVIRESVVSV